MCVQYWEPLRRLALHGRQRGPPHTIVEVSRLPLFDAAATRKKGHAFVTNGALAGITVLDLSRVLAGPYCTQLLGDYGATIVKVEEPGVGDGARGWGPPWAGDQSAYFLAANRNKQSICIDLKSPAGMPSSSNFPGAQTS